MDRFVGRTGQRQLLDDALTRARTGEGSLVVVTGEAGIGKTRFCREVAGHARRDGFAVGWGTCWSDGGAPPLWPWQEILGALGADAGVAALAGDPGGVVVDPERFARFVAVGDALGAVCARSPVLVVVDDTHVGDMAGMLLARFLSRLLSRLPLVLVLTRRTEEESTAWNPEDDARLVTLDRFGLAETAEFLGAESLDDDLLRVLLRLTGGHPLHLQHALSRGIRGRVPEGVRAAIVRGVHRLSRRTRTVVSRAALLGPAPAVLEAAVVGDVPTDVVHAALGEASAAGLVAVEDPEHFSFSHDLVREVLQGELTIAEQTDVHARAADSLARTGTGGTDRLVRLAHHALGAAARSHDDARRAVDAGRAAARALRQSFAYEQAASLLSAAAAVHEQADLPEPLGPLLVDWAEAVLRCGRLSEARGLFDRARTTARDDPVVFARAALGLGGMWINEHRTRVEYERVAGLQRRALAALPPGEVALRHRLVVRLAAEAVYHGGPLDPVLAAVDEARRFGDGLVLAEALSLCHHAMLTPRHTTARLALAEELIATASLAGDGMLALVGLCWRAVDLFHQGDSRATRALAELHDRADALRCGGVGYIASAMEVMLLIRAGRLDDAETAAMSCFALGSEVGDADALGFLGAHLTTIRWLQGRDSEVLATVDEIAGSSTLTPAEFAFEAAAAALAARAGEHDRARTGLDRLIARDLAALPQSSTWLAGMHAIAETARVLRDAGVARQVYALLMPYRHLPVMPSLAVTCLGSVERILGIAALTSGDPDGATAHLERALTTNRLLGNRPVAAVTAADLAEALLRCPRPDRERAAEVLAQAQAEAETMGMSERAAAWARRLHDLTNRGATISRRRGHWVLALGERQAVVPDRVGVRYLARLLVNPGRPVPALELAGGAAQPGLRSSLQPVLDDRARRAYRRRVEELTTELDRVEDPARAARLRRELDALWGELRRVTGMGGRSRDFADSAERARTAVRKAIKRAVDEVTAADPEIGALLRTTVTTGTSCVYTPDPAHAVRWTYADGR
jgi:tetratricopeptide (TPR) repeat protein